MNKKDLQKKIKDRMLSKSKPKKKTSNDGKKDRSIYDKLSEDERDKFWDRDTGKLIFRELTGESFYPQFVVDRAFNLFMDGLTLEEISLKWELSESTLERWSAKQNWSDKIERLFDIVESKFEKQKINDMLDERKKIDKRHRQIVAGMQREMTKCIAQDFSHEKDPKIRKMEENSLFNRVKVLKVASDVYDKMINLERSIVGISEIEDEQTLPTEFKFAIKVGHEEIDDDDLEYYLPSQDPHDFVIEDTEVMQLEVEASSLSQEQLFPVENKHKPASQIDPITIARNNGITPKVEEIKPKVNTHPAFGYLDI